MTDEIPDDEFLARLAATIDVGVGDVPPDLAEFARATSGWAVIDDELAELVDVTSMTGTRTGGDDDVASTSFVAAPFEIAVSLVDDTLVGEVVPPPAPTVVVETLATSRPVAVDDRGRFRAPSTSLPYRVRFTAGDRRITTPWVTR